MVIGPLDPSPWFPSSVLQVASRSSRFLQIPLPPLPTAHRRAVQRAELLAGLQGKCCAWAGPEVFSRSRLGRGGPRAGREPSGFKGAVAQAEGPRLEERGVDERLG